MTAEVKDAVESGYENHGTKKRGIFVFSVGIVGASGYAGRELIRFLSDHPGVELRLLVSRSFAGQKLGDVFAAFRSVKKLAQLAFVDLPPESIAQAVDCLFVAAPAGTAMQYAPLLWEAGKVLIDLGTDFRFHEPAVYEQWYGLSHTCSHLLEHSVYGLPELWRSIITSRRLIGNPGCYATSALLALAPLFRQGLAGAGPVAISSVSGISGAGSTPTATTHYPDRTENVQAYKPACHRHTPEIEGQLSRLAEKPVQVVFVPHLVPMSRGIFTTVVAPLAQPMDTRELEESYQEFYASEPFVEVMTGGVLPQTKAVTGTNFCHLGVKVDPRTQTAVIMAVLDNLGKGAAGQAVQNMNIVLGMEETWGLLHPGLVV